MTSNTKATRRKHMRLAGQLMFSNLGTPGSMKNPISKNKVQNNRKHSQNHGLYMIPNVYTQTCTHMKKQNYNKNMKTSAKYIQIY